MLTESNFHHRSHNNGPVISQHRTHCGQYHQHASHPAKAIQVNQQQPQPQQQPQQQQPQQQVMQQQHQLLQPGPQVPQLATDMQIPKFDLHHAVRTNDVAGIVRLHSRLRQQPMLADACLLDSNGHTPLYTAIANGRLAMVDLLLHLGHNPVS